MKLYQLIDLFSSNWIKVFSLITVINFGELASQPLKIPNHRIPDDIKTGYYQGNAYLRDGSIKNGLISFRYNHASNVLLKKSEIDKPEKLKPKELIGFTIEKDSFAILQNFRFESPYIGTKYINGKNGIVKVLVDGSVTLFKYYFYLDIRTPFDNYIMGRESDAFSTLFSVSTTSKERFARETSLYFQDNKEISAAILEQRVSFLDIIQIVKEYNEWKVNDQ